MNWIKNHLVLLLIIIQPLLDVMAYFALNTKYAIIPFAIRSFTLIALFFLAFLKKKNNYFVKYVFLILFFGLCHFANSIFTTNINIIEDVKEFVRVFYMPLLVISLCIIIKDRERAISQIKMGIIINMIQIFLIIILGIITGNIVHTYAEGVGLRGWFYNSNSQSVILCLIVPFSLYYIFKNKNRYLTILFAIVCFFLLYSNGTTGCYLLLVPTYGIIIYDAIFSKNNISKKVLTIVIFLIPIFCTILLYKYSPDYKISHISDNSLKDTKRENNVIKDNIEKETNNSQDGPFLPNSTIKKSHEQQLVDHYFNKKFIEDYGYESIINKVGKDMQIEKLVNNRFRKKVVASIIFDNSELTTKLLGFEFSQIKQYDVDLESDYSAILYYYGYLGMVVYLILILYTLWILLRKLINNYKCIFDSEYVLLTSMFVMLNLFAELSGSLLKRPNASIYLGLIILIIIFKYSKGIDKIEE